MARSLDVTPTKAAFEAMDKFVEAVVGEAPAKLDFGPGAVKRREARKRTFDFLHRMYGLALRHGHAMAWDEITKQMAARRDVMKGSRAN